MGRAGERGLRAKHLEPPPIGGLHWVGFGFEPRVLVNHPRNTSKPPIEGKLEIAILGPHASLASFRLNLKSAPPLMGLKVTTEVGREYQTR